MFCDQCEQTAKGIGCTIKGVCGKDNEVALQQDQLIYLLRLLSRLANQAEARGMNVEPIDDFIAETLFATLTNVNFDPKAIREMQVQALVHCRTLAAQTGEVPDFLSEYLDDLLAKLPETVVGLGTFSSNADVDSVRIQDPCRAPGRKGQGSFRLCAQGPCCRFAMGRGAKQGSRRLAWAAP